MGEPDTIQVFVPLKVRKKNGRPKILPPADYLPVRTRPKTRISCAPLAALGAGGGAWRPVSSGRCATWQSL